MLSQKKMRLGAMFSRLDVLLRLQQAGIAGPHPLFPLLLLLLACSKSHMLSASRRHLLHVSAVDRRQIWSMDKS